MRAPLRWVSMLCFGDHTGAGFRYTFFSLHYTNKSSHRAFFRSFASFISDELTKKAGELRKASLKAPLHFVLRSLRFPRTITPNRPLKQGWMLKTSSSSQRMENRKRWSHRQSKEIRPGFPQSLIEGTPYSPVYKWVWKIAVNIFKCWWLQKQLTWFNKP